VPGEVRTDLRIPFFSTRILEYSVASRLRSAALLLGLGLPVLLFGILTVRTVVGEVLGQSGSMSTLNEALAFDSGNPEVLHRKGVFYIYAGPEVDLREGVKSLRRAAELSPSTAVYWLDLGAACDSMGDALCADDAFEHAQADNPMTPRSQWMIANHYVLTGRDEAAWPVFRRLLDMSPTYAFPTFRLCLRLDSNPKVVYDKVVASLKDTNVRVAYVSFLAGTGSLDDAYRVWREMAPSLSPYDFSLSGPFLQSLIDQKRFEEAYAVWLDLGHLGVIPDFASQDSKSLVFNGGFERRPLNAGFDWRYRPAPYLSADFADSAAYRGAKCLRLDFTAARNEEFLPVSQIIPVSPGQHYRLTAYVRSLGITSDSGPRLLITDLGCPECPGLSTDAVVGTTDWHEVSLDFAAGPQSKAVLLEVWRPRGRVFPMEITGNFWLDEVAVTSLDAPGTKTERTGN